MASSLPKIKNAAENTETVSSQRNLKFKKLKFSTDNSQSIQQRFKTVKTQRLTSLERYSTVQEKREYKHEKIHMNLIERKLLNGTYDQSKEISNQLNTLKQKTDQFRIQAQVKKKEVQKKREVIEGIKKQREVFEHQKLRKDGTIESIKNKYQKQILKKDLCLSEKQCLEHMILDRKEINIFLQNRINEDKVYLQKLQSVENQLSYELRQYSEKAINIQTKMRKVEEEMNRENHIREESMFEKQTNIQKRVQGDLLRDKKSKEYIEMLNQMQREQHQKVFNELYLGIIGHKFVEKFIEERMISLFQKYNEQQNKYRQMATYRTFNSSNPHELVSRFFAHKPEEKTFRQKIQEFESLQSDLQKALNKNQEQHYRLTLTQKSAGQPESKYQSEIEKEQDLLKHEKQKQKVLEQIQQVETLIQKIRRWSERYGKQLEVKVKKYHSYEDIAYSMENIMKYSQKILKEAQVYHKTKKQKQQRSLSDKELQQNQKI